MLNKLLLQGVTVFLFLHAVVLFSLPVSAEKFQDLQPSNYVNDFADVLSQEEEEIINQKLSDLEKNKKFQVAVVTVKNLDGDYIENYAFRLYEKWGLGTKELDEGALFLISIEEKTMRIEVGYGLEPTLTDGISQIILDDYVRPEFRAGNYFAGINTGVDKIVEVVGGGEVVAKDTGNSVNSEDIFGWLVFALVFGVNILAWLFAVLARTKSWWLGGVIGFVLSLPLAFFLLGITIFGFGLVFLLTALGLLFDWAVSKNYKYWASKGFENIGGHPAWWAGGTWGPGSGTFKSSGSSWGGFGGGGSSGGGGASSNW